MDFVIGKRYECPAALGASWYAEAFEEIRRIRVGDVAVEIEVLGDGEPVVGLLEGVDQTPTEGAAVTLDTGDPMPIGIPVADIAAFTLRRETPPNLAA
jgi:hypothetical protein